MSKLIKDCLETLSKHIDLTELKEEEFVQILEGIRFGIGTMMTSVDEKSLLFNYLDEVWNKIEKKINNYISKSREIRNSTFEDFINYLKEVENCLNKKGIIKLR